MIMSRDQNIVRNGNIKIGDLSLEEVGKIKYLGSTVTDINDTREEIKRRINMCEKSVENKLWEMEIQYGRDTREKASIKKVESYHVKSHSNKHDLLEDKQGNIRTKRRKGKGRRQGEEENARRLKLIQVLEQGEYKAIRVIKGEKVEYEEIMGTEEEILEYRQGERGKCNDYKRNRRRTRENRVKKHSSPVVHFTPVTEIIIKNWTFGLFTSYIQLLRQTFDRTSDYAPKYRCAETGMVFYLTYSSIVLPRTDYRRKEFESNSAIRKSGREESSRDNLNDIQEYSRKRNEIDRIILAPKEMRSLGWPRSKWKDNIKMDLRKVGYDDRDWINLIQDMDRWRAYAKAAMSLRFP
ncbi:hypothetical protein ANN_15516 [Periplaneta americana]|uniref:Uncharacterized protein n=1 Tax=Periplaneta americana TaxID=6978 RepID=A0ABQ8SGP4_PERAM|nr:hypothetical protein ANN_15516 [Periplaneta americana]